MCQEILLPIFLMFCLGHCSGEPIVTTQSGALEGYRAVSTNGKPYDTYLAIPYAKPPINELRFKPPVPYGKWKGKLNATIDGPVCPQMNLLTNQYDGIEDCLFMNIYVSKIFNDTNRLLPVMFYIHGGGWSFESGNLFWYGPQNYMDFPVILVTFNYRLGALGFMSTNDSSSPGNYGLQDQTLALKWVNSNIKYFGGNPNQITIFGNSAGSAAAILQMLSPSSKGLFQKIISESGSAIAYWSVESNPLKYTVELANALNCSTNSTKEIVHCISIKSTKDIIEAQNKSMISGFFPVNWLPVVDGPGGILPEHPLALMTKDKIVNKVPILIGRVETEGHAFYASLLQTFRYKGEEYFNKQFPETLTAFSRISPNMTGIIDAIAGRYWKDKKDLDNQTTFAEVLVDIMGESMFGATIDDSCIRFSEAGLPVYAFIYNYIGQDCLASLFKGSCGVYSGHADELFLQFRYLSPTKPMNKNDAEMSQIINTIWVDFASKNGRPTVEGTSWPLYTKSKPQYFELNLKPSIKNGPLSNATTFWTVEVQNLLSKYNNL